MTRTERLFYRKLRNQKTSRSSWRTRQRRALKAEQSAPRRAWNTWRRELAEQGRPQPSRPWWWP